MTLRMFFLLVVTFFTSRIVLNKIGIEDFGIYNLISSIAVSFVFFSSALTNATQRFCTIELANEDTKNASKVFNQHLIVYTIIAVIVIVCAEIVGVWLIGSQLNIPDERVGASHIVFQFAILTVVASLLSIVFEALIISHEDMKIYSYVGIIEGLLKLGVAYAIIISPIDKLIFYSALMALIYVMSRVVYVLFCFRNYRECTLQFVWNYSLIKKTSKFIGWNVLGTAQVAICDQGISILLNMFFGPIANAARGITSQVGGAVAKFVNGFLVAIQPQIVKSYAQNDIVYLTKLFYSASRLSYVILWLFACPILITIEDILGIWLLDVPMWTADMIRLSMLGSCIYVLSKPIWFIVIADGKLKRYAVVTSLISFMLFPFSYIAFLAGSSPLIVYMLNILLHGISIIFQLRILKGLVEIKYFDYIKYVIVRIIIMSVISVIVCNYVYRIIKALDISNLIIIVGITLISVFITFIIGLEKSEKMLVYQKMINVYKYNI